MPTSLHPHIRRLRPADAPDHRALMLASYRRHPDAFTASVAEREPLPLAWWEARVADGDDAAEVVFGAWDGDVLVGAAGLRFEQRPKTRHKATLLGMAVRAESAGRGIGRRLVEAVLDAARARSGVRVVQLTVTDGNRAAAALYARCGFVAFGTEPLAIAVDDGYSAKVHLWLDLSPPRR